MNHFILFLWISFLITFTPGTSILFTVSQSVRMGVLASIPSLLGNVSASIVYGIISICSVGYFLRTHANFIKGIAILGSSYLICTGIFFIFKKTKTSLSTLSGIIEINKKCSMINDFLNGLIVSLANPKIFLFYLIVIPQFANHTNNIELSLIFLICIQNIMKVTSLIFYSALANTARKWLNKIGYKAIHRFSGIVIIIAGIILLVDNLDFSS